MLPVRFEGDWRIDSSGTIITWPFQKPPKSASQQHISVASEETDEDDASSFIGRRVPLRAHTMGVVNRARRYAEGCGLAVELIDDIVLAAELHDLGKCDERFQRWLHGRPFGEGDELLAKSGERRTPADDRRIRRAAGYPDRARHEAGSVMAARQIGLLDHAHDADLVLYLIGVHHGWGRPFFPVWHDDPNYRFPVQSNGVFGEITPGAELARIDSCWVDRFWTLNRKYGYWGLAYLESILRRADCMQSRWEERRESN
jgi:CRISPR-associated endonuclease/helicase Cas3